MQKANLARAKVRKRTATRWTISTSDDRRGAEREVGQEGLPRGAHQRGGGKAVAGHFGDRARQRGQRPHGRVGGPRRQAESPLRKAQRPGFGPPPLPGAQRYGLTCWLIPGAQWHGGGDTLPDGTFFDPNMPTEEVFTSPMRGRCVGEPWCPPCPVLPGQPDRQVLHHFCKRAGGFLPGGAGPGPFRAHGGHG